MRTVHADWAPELLGLLQGIDPDSDLVLADLAGQQPMNAFEKASLCDIKSFRGSLSRNVNPAKVIICTPEYQDLRDLTISEHSPTLVQVNERIRFHNILSFHALTRFMAEFYAQSKTNIGVAQEFYEKAYNVQPSIETNQLYLFRQQFWNMFSR